VEGARSHSTPVFVSGQWNNLLTIVYYNARSVLVKMDELAATCQACGPNIICIVESWFSSDITDDKVSLPNRSAIRLNRNCHSGGIIVFLKNNVMSGLACLEIIFVSILMPVIESFV